MTIGLQCSGIWGLLSFFSVVLFFATLHSHLFYEERICIMTSPPLGSQPCACTFDVIWNGLQDAVTQSVNICGANEIHFAETCVDGYEGFTFECCVHLTDNRVQFQGMKMCNNSEVSLQYVLLSGMLCLFIILLSIRQCVNS